MQQTTKERHAGKNAQERARQTNYENMIKQPPPKTWSARMPAYCFTPLCPDREWRTADREKGEGNG